MFKMLSPYNINIKQMIISNYLNKYFHFVPQNVLK